MSARGALTGAPKAPKGDAKGTTPPEGEGNPAEGGSSRVVLNPVKYRNKIHIFVRQPDFSVILREISGLTTDFKVILLL